MAIRAQFRHILFLTGSGNRPEWSIFDHIFPDCWITGVESGTTDFTGRKTGLFIPIWEADLLLDVLGWKKGKKGEYLIYPR